MPSWSVSYYLWPATPTRAFPSRKAAPRPLLAVTLINNRLTWDCYAIVDSGADDCIFPYSFGLQIGLNVAAGKQYSFIGASSGIDIAYFFDIELEIPNVGRYRQPIGFTTGLENVGIGLLGQNGFFNKFTVQFDLRNGLFRFDDGR